MSQINVTITDERGESKTVTNNVPQQTNDPVKAVSNEATPQSANTTANKKSSQGLAVASMIASRAFNYCTSNVGKWTGNSNNQTIVNNVSQVVSLGAMMYASPWMAAATAAVQVGTTAIEAAYNNKWDNRRAARQQAKAGETTGRRH